MTSIPGWLCTLSFKYDPFGRRIYKSSSSGTSIYAYDASSLIEETNASGAVVARYAPGENIDEPLADGAAYGLSEIPAENVGSFFRLDGLPKFAGKGERYFFLLRYGVLLNE